MWMVAVFYPVIENYFLIPSKKIIAEQVVEKILQYQRQVQQLKNTYSPFASGQMPKELQERLGSIHPATHEFSYDVFLDKAGVLTIRARTSDRFLHEESFPLLTFIVAIDPMSGNVTKRWIE
ncbi:MAG: hypothetical protein G8345_11335 [Magnetococcales bacterium]|nr:hypothetical protein [Magnetococcales bacterium]